MKCKKTPFYLALGDTPLPWLDPNILHLVSQLHFRAYRLHSLSFLFSCNAISKVICITHSSLNPPKHANDIKWFLSSCNMLWSLSHSPLNLYVWFTLCMPLHCQSFNTLSFICFVANMINPTFSIKYATLFISYNVISNFTLHFLILQVLIANLPTCWHWTQMLTSFTHLRHLVAHNDTWSDVIDILTILYK